jgi:alanine-synthesizing transaminase
LWVISDLAYADLVHDGRPAPSIFQVPGARDLAVEFFTVSKSYSMPGWRVGFCVGNRTLVGALATIKGYLDYGIFAPVQLAAATALSPACDADVAGNRELYKHRAALLCRELSAAGWAVPLPVASMFVWAPLPARAAADGAVRFAAELLERARVAVSPGVGFGPGGEGYVRFALVETDDRTRKACAAIGAYLGSGAH